MPGLIFSKWHGLGNDFILVWLPANPAFHARNAAEFLCDRRMGIGADGVVTIRPLERGACEMRIFNSDGSETEMCGNATRCVGKYLRRYVEPERSEFALHTKAGVIRPSVLADGSVRVDMGEPVVSGSVTLRYDEREFTAQRVSMGNPHAVIFVSDIKAIELEKWGAAFERDPQFPNKTNVEFVEVQSPEQFRMRVWERGCGVTMACGTGSCATAVAGVLTGRGKRNVAIQLDGGELRIEYSEVDNHVYMTGPAVEVFHGELREI